MKAGPAHRKLRGRLLDTLFPPACVLCQRLLDGGSAPVCRLCWHRLPRLAPPLCPRCGATRVLEDAAGEGCSECVSWPEEYPRTGAVHRMEAGAAELVHALKYNGWTALAAPMAGSMTSTARRLAGRRRHLLVPVPLSAPRLRERGFNQAALLARELAGRLGWRCEELLHRDRPGRRQARLGRRQRRENTRSLFSVVRPARVGEGHVLVVDDVVTTGSTAAACARALEAAGWRVGGAVAFARALHPIDTR